MNRSDGAKGGDEIMVPLSTVKTLIELADAALKYLQWKQDVPPSDAVREWLDAVDDARFYVGIGEASTEQLERLEKLGESIRTLNTPKGTVG